MGWRHVGRWIWVLVQAYRLFPKACCVVDKIFPFFVLPTTPVLWRLVRVFFSGLRVPTSPSQVEVGRVRDGFVLQYKSSLKRGTTTTRGVIMVLISFWVATRGVVDHFTFTTFARRVDSSLFEDKLLEGFFLESETKFGFDINSATHKLQSYCYGSMYLRHVSPGAGGFIDQWNWCSIPISPLTEGQRKSGLVSE